MTPETLIQMNDRDFEELACENLYTTAAWQGPFQHPTVIHRTLSALSMRLSFTDSFMDRVADDPEYPAMKWKAAEKFRAHLVATISNTERRLEFLPHSRRVERIWKKIVNEILDELEGSEMDWILDEFNLNEYFGETDGLNMSLREWLDVRRVKNPNRVPEREGDAA